VFQSARIAVVLPCYKSSRQVLGVINKLPPWIDRIYVVDDACPEQTGTHVSANLQDARLVVIGHAKNHGVGGAVVSGYQAALNDQIDIIIKIDSDGQMDPALIPLFVAPIVEGRADYTKGNRFFELESLRDMPRVRLFGNAALSLVNKFSSGYWDVMDPTNGFTAIHTKVLRRMPLDKLARRYFFESDMLFRLGTMRAVVLDIPMESVYADEKSNLRVSSVLLDFPGKYLSRFLKRLFYNYLLRDFNAGSVQLLLGLLFLSAGATFGAWHWLMSVSSGVVASSGTVMLAAMPVLLGGHLLIGAMNYDIASVPKRCLHQLLS
jgi:dolichol-phosphate mannosyltransferase